MRFEWTAEKERANIRKHGLSFVEATTLFTGDREYLVIYDERHSDDEDRFIAIGPIAAGILVVVYTERTEDSIRIISARFAGKNEIRLFRGQQGR